MLTYIPCTVAGICARDVVWKPIEPHPAPPPYVEIRSGSRRAA